MKKFIFQIKYLSLLLLIGILHSCQEEDIQLVPSTSTSSEIEKIETIFKEGDVKLENNSGEKIETLANAELKAKISKDLENEFSKETTYKKTGFPYFSGYGVFKNTTCGQYKTLKVFMDCEDNRSWTSVSGQVGASRKIGNNILLEICVVPSSMFERGSNKYAVINLNEQLLNLKEAGMIIRQFDNEDRRNTNYANYNGSNFSKSIGGVYYGEGAGTHTILGAKNTRLSFHCFKSSGPNGSGYANLGFSYSVLGTFGSKRGTIYFDDEDSRNANGCAYSEWDIYTRKFLPSRSPINNRIPEIMDVGGNTKFYISSIY